MNAAVTASRGILARTVVPALRTASVKPQKLARQLATATSGAAVPRRGNGTAAILAGVAGAVFVGGSVLSNDSRIVAKEETVDWDKVRSAIELIIEDDAPMGPTFLRLAWHASGTYCASDKTGGSNGGCIRHNPEAGHGANAGLHLARDSLEKVKTMFPGMSYADLYTFAGVVAISQMGGPDIKWEPGRVDFVPGSGTPDGRLPDADKGEIKQTIQHLRDIFHRMGFNDQEIVALAGAHSLGRYAHRHVDMSAQISARTFADDNVEYALRGVPRDAEGLFFFLIPRFTE